MKRVVFAAVLLFFLIGFNIFCLETVTSIKDDMTSRLDFLQYTLENGTAEETALECEKFTEYWLEEHHILCRIVRHELLDRTTEAVSHFVPLAEYGEYGELSAKINSCRFLIEEIWDSELPAPRNIF